MQLSKHHHKSEFLYSMSGQVLKIAERHSYLGVIIDHQLSWKPHIDYVAMWQSNEIINNWVLKS